MTNAELIKALRYCANENTICTEIENCGYYGKGFFCQDTMMLDAADALEAAERLLDQNTKRCEALRKQLRESHESYEKHINELEAQIPKRGEWIDLFGHDYKCSVCGEWYRMDGTPEQEDMNYCPYCGARMRGEHDE